MKYSIWFQDASLGWTTVQPGSLEYTKALWSVIEAWGAQRFKEGLAEGGKEFKKRTEAAVESLEKTIGVLEGEEA